MLIHCPYFAMYSCQYDVQKSREATARVAVWREFGIASSFTLECSYCGFEKGPNKVIMKINTIFDSSTKQFLWRVQGSSFGTSQLLEIGETLCLAIYTMSCRLQPFPQMVEEGTHSMFVTWDLSGWWFSLPKSKSHDFLKFVRCFWNNWQFLW